MKHRYKQKVVTYFVYYRTFVHNIFLPSLIVIWLLIFRTLYHRQNIVIAGYFKTPTENVVCSLHDKTLKVPVCQPLLVLATIYISPQLLSCNFNIPVCKRFLFCVTHRILLTRLSSTLYNLSNAHALLANSLCMTNNLLSMPLGHSYGVCPNKRVLIIVEHQCRAFEFFNSLMSSRMRNSLLHRKFLCLRCKLIEFVLPK